MFDIATFFLVLVNQYNIFEIFVSWGDAVEKSVFWSFFQVLTVLNPLKYLK